MKGMYSPGLLSAVSDNPRTLMSHLTLQSPVRQVAFHIIIQGDASPFVQFCCLQPKISPSSWNHPVGKWGRQEENFLRPRVAVSLLCSPLVTASLRASPRCHEDWEVNMTMFLGAQNWRDELIILLGWISKNPNNDPKFSTNQHAYKHG